MSRVFDIFMHESAEVKNKIPMPPPIEQFQISKESAIQKTITARQELFELEKGKTYYEIFEAANKGNYHLIHKYPENCNTENIIKLQDELTEKGFKTNLTYGIYGDSLEISWYPNEIENK